MLNYQKFNPDPLFGLESKTIHLPTPLGVISVSTVAAENTISLKFVAANLPFIESEQNETYLIYIQLPTYLNKTLLGYSREYALDLINGNVEVIMNVVSGLSSYFGLIDVIECNWIQ